MRTRVSTWMLATVVQYRGAVFERRPQRHVFEIGLHGGELIVCDKGYAGRDFEAQVAERFGARILRPARQDEYPSRPGAVVDPPTHRVDLLDAQRRSGSNDTAPEASTGLRARIATKLPALAAGVWLNHYLGEPARAFARLAA